jgi:hypothetical protein
LLAVELSCFGIVQSWRELNPGYEPGFLHLEDSTSPPIK